LTNPQNHDTLLADNKERAIMKLITAAIQKKLEKNFKQTLETGKSGDVVLKLFGGSNCTWLITDIDTDGDTMSGLCDIGQGYCEFGTVSLKELQSVRFPPFGLPVERDRFFKGGSIEQFQQYYNEHGSLNGC
jgi:hypothetical protein